MSNCNSSKVIPWEREGAEEYLEGIVGHVKVVVITKKLFDQQIVVSKTLVLSYFF